MNPVTAAIQRYYRSSRSAVFSYLVSLPLLILYELLIYLTEANPSHYVRIEADVWIKSLLSMLGYNSVALTFALALLIGVFLFIKERKKEIHLQFSHFVFLIIESLVYAVVLGLLISRLTSVLTTNAALQGNPNVHLSPIQRFALSLGAGLYEELVFRLVLVNVLLYICRIFRFSTFVRYFISVVLAAFLFSLAHYTGPLGDPFTIYSFLFRFFFGLALTLIYVTRGFGVAAWTHALYDTLLIFIV